MARQQDQAVERTFAVGDIHGCSPLLRRLLERIPFDPEADTLVFLGDYLDRGPDARGVVEEVLRLKETFKHAICLRGNHEQMFLDCYLDGRNEELFLANGGAATLSSYGLSLREALAGKGFPEEHLRFLSSLPLCHETEEHLFVHAGLRPGIPLAGQSSEDLLWIRDEFIESNWDFGKTVVFGHTPLCEPLLGKDRIGIDTGAVYGGRLTCIELPSRRIFQA
jgi:serine/threonine protein phosphatase 1